MVSGSPGQERGNVMREGAGEGFAAFNDGIWISRAGERECYERRLWHITIWPTSGGKVRSRSTHSQFDDVCNDSIERKSQGDHLDSSPKVISAFLKHII